MLPTYFYSFLRRAAILVCVLVVLLSLNFIAPASVSAYSLKDLKQQAIEAKAAVTETAADIGGSAIGAASSIGTDIGGKALQSSKATVGRAVQVGKKVGSASLKAGKAAANTALEAGEVVSETTLQVGKIAADLAVDTTTTVSSSALKVGRAAIETAEDVSVVTAQKTALLVGQASEGIKSASEAVASQIADSFERYAQPLLETAIAQVDLNQIKATVKQVQQEVADHKAETLAKHLVDRKVVQASATDNWLETARLQAEMIYEIAAVYGFQSDDVNRKQEILDIAAANLGSSKLLGNALPLVKYAVGFIPGGNIASIAVDVGSDHLIRMLMFPLLGGSACKHYAALQAPEPESSPAQAVSSTAANI